MKTRRFSRRVLATIAALGVLATTGTLASDPATASPGQIVTTISSGLNAEDLAQSLVGEGVSISNVVYTGSPDSAGAFEGMGAIGFDSGVTLSSGNATDVVGPNTDDARGTVMNTPGDPELEAITGLPSYDAAVLEFDFVPSTDDLVFEYVFGSEEYPEYVDSSVNDVFAFFVNGTNCALVGDPQVAVSIDTINAGLNTDLYRPNHLTEASVWDPDLEQYVMLPAQWEWDGEQYLPGPDAVDTELDGMTTVLTCNASVNSGEVNHIKLAISDSGDAVWDSAVFIRAGSIRANTAPVATDDTYSTQVDQALDVSAPGVLTNDTDADGDLLSASLGTGPANGSLTLAADGSFSYTPTPGFEGTDTFTYLASDGSLRSNVATVTITVNPSPNITGVVSTPASAAVRLDGAMVLAYEETTTSFIPSGGAYIVPDGPGGLTGTYVLDDLEPGRYSLVFVAESDGGVTIQWAGGSQVRAGSTDFEVTSDEQITPAPEHVVATSTITGTVTVNGSPLAGTLVMVYGPTDGHVGTHWTRTGADGTYSIPAIRADSHRVQFIPPAGSGFERQWYSTAPTRSTASVLSIAGGTTVSDIDAFFGVAAD